MTLFLNGYVQAKLCLICDTQQKGRLKTGKTDFSDDLSCNFCFKRVVSVLYYGVNYKIF